LYQSNVFLEIKGMRRMSENQLDYRIAIHTRTEQEAKRLLDILAQLFGEEKYFVVRVEPRANRNPSVSLETFALLSIYEKDVIQ
jgi:hypothetical protein